MEENNEEQQENERTNDEGENVRLRRESYRENRGACPSYQRPNRDYSSHIVWTYELNKNLYDCLVKADKSKLGYMERLKDLWILEHLELKHLNKNHLSQEARRVVQRGLIKETNNNSSNVDNQDMSGPVQMQEQRTPEEISGSSQNDVSDTSNTLQDSQEEYNINSDTQANETENQESTQSETEERIALTHELKQAWLTNFEKYMNIGVKDREFYIKQDRKIPEEELEIVNEIISEYMTELSEAYNLLAC